LKNKRNETGKKSETKRDETRRNETKRKKNAIDYKDSKECYWL
jgi:hypothetical protein